MPRSRRSSTGCGAAADIVRARLSDHAHAHETNIPPALRPGTLMHVVAPSGPVDPPRLDKGLRALQRVLTDDAPFELAQNLFEADGYFAGPDDARAASLHKWK